MIRKIAAVVFGAILAIVLIIAIERLSHTIFPTPPGLDINDKESLQAFMSSAPVGALLLVGVAWMVGAFGGGMLATGIAQDAAVTNCWIIGGLVLAGAIMNLVSIPHPLWFTILSVVAVIATTILTSRLAACFVTGNLENIPETNGS